MDHDGWHKSMSHFPSVCCSLPLNPQMLFYDGHGSHFYDRVLNILHRNHIQFFILKAGDSVHDQSNYNGSKMKLGSLYGNSRMNWMRHNGTLKLTPHHMNFILVETWEALKLLSATITKTDFKKTHLPPLYPLYIGTNHQPCLAGIQQSNIEKAD